MGHAIYISLGCGQDAARPRKSSKKSSLYHLKDLMP